MIVNPPVSNRFLVDVAFIRYIGFFCGEPRKLLLNYAKEPNKKRQMTTIHREVTSGGLGPLIKVILFNDTAELGL